jgi:hypothetical protein
LKQKWWRKLSLEETITFNLELNVENALSSSRRVELIIFRALGLWVRLCKLFGLPPDSPAIQIVESIQRVTMVLRQLHSTIIFVEAASGPIGWAMAGLSAAALVMSVSDITMSLGE